MSVRVFKPDLKEGKIFNCILFKFTFSLSNCRNSIDR